MNLKGTYGDLGEDYWKDTFTEEDYHKWKDALIKAFDVKFPLSSLTEPKK